MRLSVIAAAAALIAAPAVAAPAGIDFIGSDGSHYQSVSTRNGDGSVDIAGRVSETREAFALHVDQRGNVSGSMGEMPINFVVSKATLAELNAQTAMRVAAN